MLVASKHQLSDGRLDIAHERQQKGRRRRQQGRRRADETDQGGWEQDGGQSRAGSIERGHGGEAGGSR